MILRAQARSCSSNNLAVARIRNLYAGQRRFNRNEAACTLANTENESTASAFGSNDLIGGASLYRHKAVLLFWPLFFFVAQYFQTLD
jgi:hypothetical protein